MTAEVSAFDDLHWTATRYSQAMGIDVRAVNERLATIPHSMRGARKVWHVREGMPALFGCGKKKTPSDMEPKDRLDHYRAERENIKLQEEIRNLLPAVDVERSVGEAYKVLAQGLSAIPDLLERECGLSSDTVISLHNAIDAVRETLYLSVVELMNNPDLSGIDLAENKTV